MGLINNAHFIAADRTRKELEKQGKRGEREASMLEQLLWETRQTNRMLWVSLTDEQRAGLVAMDPA